MDALIDSMPLENLSEGQFLVSVEHETEKTISVLVCGTGELGFLGCPDLASIPDGTGIRVTDSDDDTHMIKILKKA